MRTNNQKELKKMSNLPEHIKRDGAIFPLFNTKLALSGENKLSTFSIYFQYLGYFCRKTYNNDLYSNGKLSQLKTVQRSAK